ncbi:MAG: hypothetical protein VKP62_10065 [Candidatus Sericytochromatia bacterium]|nr:hypothetical protein [Candidatus Sericytochromatia bacterium]
MEHFSRFLNEVPLLADLLQQAIRAQGKAGSNTEEQRGILESVHGQVMNTLKANRTIYAVRLNPEAEHECPACRTSYRGDYVEFNNAATGKSVVCASMLVHALVAHGQLVITTTVRNVSGTRVAEAIESLDLPGLLAVLKDGQVPSEVLEGAHAAELAREQARGALPTPALAAH